MRDSMSGAEAAGRPYWCLKTPKTTLALMAWATPQESQPCGGFHHITFETLLIVCMFFTMIKAVTSGFSGQIY